MADFHDVRFPARLGFGASGGPQIRVDVVRLASGHEKRNARWSAPLRRYALSVGIRPMSELRVLLDFFEARSGALYGFRFRDPFHHSTGADQSQPTMLDIEMGFGDGVTTSFALMFPNGRKISRPRSESLQIAFNGTEILSGYQLDSAQGIVTFEQPPAEGELITAGCEFDVPVRFENEQLLVTQISENAGEIPEISLLEIRE